MTRTADLVATARARMATTYAPAPFVIDRGEGMYLWDLDGTRYLDFTSGIGVNAVGHCHPEVVEAIREQAGRYCHTANLLYHAGHIEMCERLCELSFGDRVFLTNSGVEAGEAALKLARRYAFKRGETRPTFVATHGSFHGRSIATLSVTGQESYREGYGPLLPDVTLVPFADVEALRAVVDGRTAAVILEPIQGNSGIKVAPDDYLRGVREICDAAGCLLIFDEIQSGVGRSGKWWAHEHAGVTPDIMMVAKGVGGGLPLGAMVTSEVVGAAFTPGSHGTTFGGNPVCCAAGLACLRIIERDDLLGRATRLGERLRAGLRALEHPRIREVRGRGLMVGVEIDGAAKDVRSRLRERNLLTTLGGPSVIRLLPPLIVEEAHIDEAVAMIGAAL